MQRSPDAIIRQVAESRYGDFHRREARAAGHSLDAIDYRLKRGVWRRIFPETYAIVGSPRSWHQTLSAACLWSQGLAASTSAGFLYGIPGCDQGMIEVMTTNHTVLPHSGIVVHHTNWLPGEQMTVLERIPVTSVERTLMSLCALLPRHRAAIAVDHALNNGLTTLALIDRHLYFTARRGRDGCATLRELMKERLTLDGVPTSPLETVIFEMIVADALPLPKPQFEIHDEMGSFVARPDFVYPEEKLIVEGHSRRWHEGDAARRRDSRKHDALEQLGYRIVYVTWGDATRRKTSTTQLIRRMLDDPTFGSPRRSVEWGGGPLPGSGLPCS